MVNKQLEVFPMKLQPPCKQYKGEKYKKLVRWNKDRLFLTIKALNLDLRPYLDPGCQYISLVWWQSSIKISTAKPGLICWPRKSAQVCCRILWQELFICSTLPCSFLKLRKRNHLWWASQTYFGPSYFVRALTLLGLGSIKINDVSANCNNPRPSLILNN